MGHVAKHHKEREGKGRRLGIPTCDVRTMPAEARAVLDSGDYEHEDVREIMIVLAKTRMTAPKGSYKRVTEEDRYAVYYDWKRGIGVYTLADRYDMSTTTVYTIIREMRIREACGELDDSFEDLR